MDDARPGPRRAIALEYDGEGAPRISALGADSLAEQIITLAREHGVPMMENAELAGLLAQLDLGDEVPEALYRCVAQIIAFAYRLRGRVPAGFADATDWSASAEEPPCDWPLLPGPEFSEP